ncbi:RNA polymerase sigma factor [Chromobacterium sphagni]|uniref:RNA polymerase subunit sigma-24 n=1 Tax=Chromobacterium sphagni TaxID=1903179 RepID=A0A1S1X092_9NEIS|nr:sigma-70 family RNA polymerase sigma factor [Chromobacterium sphagni]OHX12606.1 RNA polymerase subunit sigma-24 [Chromobacterium sphagni]OHX21309.1 RNA polymerase subunit sigma-24 [Chromobacterium sphagni]
MKFTKNEDSIQPLAAVWREIQPKLQRRARHLCKGDTHRADELLSDTALKVHLYLQHSAERVQNLAGFLFLALNHAFLDFVRRQGRENLVIDPNSDLDCDTVHAHSSNAPTPEQLLTLKQQLARMEAALAGLKPEQQRLFQLKFQEDLPYPQIASSLGINEALARKRVELLRKALRKHLDQDFTPPGIRRT